ncbi:SRPBCC domain-containing protein [Enterobacter hormaechei]
MTLDPETDLKLERVVDAPRDLLWLCWTTPEHIKKFFIPAPHKVTECDLDLRVGGRFNTVFEVDGSGWITGAYSLKSIREKAGLYRRLYRRLETGREAVYDGNFAPGRRREGKTRYKAIARHPTKEIREQHEQMGFHEGWGIVLDRWWVCERA